MRTSVVLLVQTGSDEMCHNQQLDNAAQFADPQVACGAYRACRFWWTIFLLLVVE